MDQKDEREYAPLVWCVHSPDRSSDFPLSFWLTPLLFLVPSIYLLLDISSHLWHIVNSLNLLFLLSSIASWSQMLFAITRSIGS